eukprot:Tbor_TRINITY_DN2055_c0_g1::TRINITY_DN2055_c0_g1_i1::g.12126::m.12126/K13100/CWC22; pre-mRNA-splicing factor CWC22
MPYVPPFKRATVEGGNGKRVAIGFSPSESAPEPSDTTLQRKEWNALSRRIIGAVNRASPSNFTDCAASILRRNIIRGKGIYCKAVMRMQEENPQLSEVFCALTSVINRHFPEVGALLVKRLVIQWRRYYRRKNLPGIQSTGKFINNLFTFHIIDGNMILKMLSAVLCQDEVTEFHIDIGTELFRGCFKSLEERHAKEFHFILGLFRDLLHADPKILSVRSESVVVTLFDTIQSWQSRKSSEPIIPKVYQDLFSPDIDPQMHSEIDFDDEDLGGNGTLGNSENTLDRFQYDPDYSIAEELYNEQKTAILGVHVEDSEEDPNIIDDGDEYLFSTEDFVTDVGTASNVSKEVLAKQIEAKYEKTKEENVLNAQEELKQMFESSGKEQDKIREKVVKIIQASQRSEEAAHRLIANIEKGNEPIICVTVTEACCQQKAYDRRFGLIAANLCNSQQHFRNAFEKLFQWTYYSASQLSEHHLECHAKIFTHLLVKHRISWKDSLEVVSIMPSSSDFSQRVFFKTIIRGLVDELTAAKVKELFDDPRMKKYFQGFLPINETDTEKVRASIDFFTNIGGTAEELAVGMKDWLNMIIRKSGRN